MPFAIGRESASLLGGLRGRELRVGGGKVTDIDAIGAEGGRLLLVSCKSVVYSADYDMGEYRSVRNAASTVVKAVTDWQGKVQYLSENRRGDNFDLNEFSEFIPVVCTPTAVHVPLGEATREIQPGLRAAMSLRELANWIRASVPR